MTKIILLAGIISVFALANTTSDHSQATAQATAPKWPYGRTLVVAPFGGVNLSTASAYIAGPEVRPLFGVSAAYFFSEKFGFGLGVHLNPRRFSSIGGSTANSALFVELPVGVAYRNEGDLFSKTSVNLLKIGMSVAIPTENFTGNMVTAVSMVSKTYFSLAMEASTLYPVNDSLAIGPIFVLKYGLTQPVDTDRPDLRPVEYSLGLQAAF